MQIHIEAHLILNINTSVSEFAMKMFPPRTSCHSLLVSAEGESGTKTELLCRQTRCPMKVTISVLVEIQTLK